MDREEEVDRKISELIVLDEADDVDPSVKKLDMLESLSNLESHIKESCSPNWNGARKYDGSMHYLGSRFKSGDYALGPLADEFEEITQTRLSASGINKKILFANVLWEQAAAGYLKVVQLPSLENYDCGAALAAIEAQAENAVKFMRHIGSSTVLFRRLLERHEEYCHEFQLLICQLVAGKEYKKGLGRPEAIDELSAYFSDGNIRYFILAPSPGLATNFFCRQSQIKRLNRTLRKSLKI